MRLRMARCPTLKREPSSKVSGRYACCLDLSCWDCCKVSAICTCRIALHYSTACGLFLSGSTCFGGHRKATLAEPGTRLALKGVMGSKSVRETF